MTVAGTIAPKPETVREACLIALRDLARAYRKNTDDAAADVDIYERVLRDFLPEAVSLGAQRCMEEERFYPAPATLRQFVHAEHARIVASRNAIVPRRGESEDGMVCWTCGARAYDNGKRLVMDHDPRAHGVFLRGALL